MTSCLALAAVPLATLFAGCVAVGSFVRPTEPPPVLGPRAPHFRDALVFQRSAFFLEPVPAPGKGGLSAEAAWRDLLPGMAADVETRKLYCRLYGGEPVEFAVLPATAAENATAFTALPGGHAAVAVRVCERGSRLEPMGGGQVLIGVVSLARVTVLTDVRVTLAQPDAITEPSPPLHDLEAFEIAAQDYGLRHGTGWAAVRGRRPGAGEVPA
jgi:hypothetical protein